MPIATREAGIVWEGALTRVSVPELEPAGFELLIARAADLCPVSNALRGNAATATCSELEQ
ncbi:MAG TPA: hypothetical protein VJ741_22085 [Solirubrobacteraceae bacterium]|nr:hypothetical protein [Solirubrobacteraceae bacterium]